MPSTPRRVAVLGGNRIPFARQNTVYANASNQDMLTAALDGLVERYGLQGERLGEFAAGAVLKHSRDFNLAREVVLGSKLSPETPAYDVQQACGTGLQAAIQVANKIALGQIEVGVAGGSDTTSDAPIAVGEGLRKALLEANRAKDLMGRLAALAKVRPGDLVPAIPQNGEPRTGLSMGEHAALTALEWSIAREDQDALAARSHHNLAAAYESGFLADTMTPYLGHQRDENLRPDSSIEKLAKLKPVFGKGEAATMTAGNSTPLSDGASTVLLASEEWAKAHDLPVLAYMTVLRDRRGRLRHRPRGPADGAGVRDAADARARRATPSTSSTSTRSTRRSPRRCWPRSRRGRTRSSARSASASTPRWVPSTATSSTCTARRWPRVTRSPPPAAGSSTCSPRSSPRRAAARASSRSAPPVARV